MNNLSAQRYGSHRNVSCKLSTLLPVNNSVELEIKDQNNLFFGRKEVVTHNSEISNSQTIKFINQLKSVNKKKRKMINNSFITVISKYFKGANKFNYFNKQFAL